MKRMILSALLLLVAAVGAQAKSWKIGPSSVVGMDFASINAAMESENVAAGDTLFLDQYYNENVVQTVTKAVVIIGTGYDTTLTDEGVVARLVNVLEFKVNHAVVKSVMLGNVYFYNSNCTVERCYTSHIITQSSTAGTNHIYSCYVAGVIRGYGSDNDKLSKLDIQNCVVSYSSSEACIYNLTSSIIKNNVIIRNYNSYYCVDKVYHSEITNNIILHTYSSYYGYDLSGIVEGSGSGNTIEHNILGRNGNLYYYPTNKTGYGASSSEIFVCTGTYSNYYKLADSSVAKGYATDGGDCGCHGGMFGCPSGGRPQYIPYFTKVVVGSRTENGKLPVSVSVKIQDE